MCAPVLLLVSYMPYLRSAAERLTLASRGWCTARRRIASEALNQELEVLPQPNALVSQCSRL
jgi:hypothetical protein